MPEWTTALPDWQKRIVERRSLVPCAPLFPAEAEAALAQFKMLRIVDAAGTPSMGEVCRQWVFDFVSAVFGAYDEETGRRLISEFFLLVSKKNSKSTIAAGIMLTALIRNWRNSNEFLILAPTIEIANNSFHPARDMVRANEELSDLFHVQEHLRQITHRGTKATLKVVAADDETVGGKKAAGVLVDELWLFGKRPNAENMLREATGGRASRPEGFTVYLSTQSDEPPAGVFAQILDDFRSIRDGSLVAPRRLGVLYEYPPAMIEGEAYRDPATWFVTNPNLGASVDEQFLLDEQQKAERAGLHSVAGFYAKHVNVEIGLRLRSNRWAGAEYWPRRTLADLTLERLLERSETVVVGIDGGGLDDLFGIAVLGRDRETQHWLAWCHAWCHSGVLERRRTIAARLRDFEAAGDLTIVDDELDDLAGITEIVERAKDSGLLVEVGVDPAGLGEMVDAMAAIGVTEESKLLVGVGQGYRLMNAIKTAERRLANGTLWHSRSALMDWCVGNVKIEPTATAIRATKQTAGDAKIDPWCALMNACDRMTFNPVAIDLLAMVA
jgi:phage terminase large subunit-like protein